MKSLCAFLAAAAIALPALSIDIAGTWVGGTTALGSPTFVQADFTRNGDVFRGSMEVPSEDVTLPLRDVVAKDAAISFRMPSPYGEFQFSGTLDGDMIRGRIKTPMGTEGTMHFRRSGSARSATNAYAGTFRLPNGDYVINMERPYGQLRSVNTGSLASLRLVPIGGDRFLDAASIIVDPSAGHDVEFARDGDRILRIGEAKRVDPLTMEDVTFKNGDVGLSGTLLRPRAPGRHAAAVVVHGSGAVTRDAMLLRAQLLLRMGVAVLLYDKRGTGSSTGQWRSASFEDLAGDAVAALQYLRSRPDIDPEKLGVVGHSQAGWIIPIVADRDQHLAFAIVASGGGVSPEAQELFRAEVQTRKDFTADDALQAKQLTALMWTWAKSGAGWDEYQKAWQAAAAKPWFRRIAGPRTSDDPLWAQVRLFAAHDPLPYLARMKTPTLVVFGTDDENVPAARAAELWRGPAFREVIMVPGTGHNLMVRQKDGSSYAPRYVEAMRTWLQKHGIVSKAIF